MARQIAGGAFSQLKLEIDGVWKPIGYVSSVAYDEGFGVIPMNVINHIGPVDHDVHNYSCTINIGFLIQENPANIGISPDGGEVSFESLIPLRAAIQANGEVAKFNGLMIVNTSTNRIAHQFHNVIITNAGTNISPGSFNTGNVSMSAIERLV